MLDNHPEPELDVLLDKHRVPELYVLDKHPEPELDVLDTIIQYNNTIILYGIIYYSII